MKIVDLTGGGAATSVQTFLDEKLSLSAMLEDTGVPVVIFEAAVDDRHTHPEKFFDAMQRALTSVQSHGRAIYVSRVTVGEIVGAGRKLVKGTPTKTFDGLFPPLHTAQGVFAGYLAFGEGGLAFFDPTGKNWGVNPPSQLFTDAISAMMGAESDR